ncbi:MAG: PAS domain-containing protein [Gemmatimonadota bacterium]
MIDRSDSQSQDRAQDPAVEEPRVEELVDTIPCALYGYVRWADGRSRFVYMSAQCEEIFGHAPDRIVREPDLLWNMVHPDDRDRLEREDEASNRSGKPFRSEVRIVMPDGGVKWIQLSSMPSPQSFQGQVLWSGVILDITEKKQADEERDRLVAELQDALARIRKLEGIIPICGFCKRIRDPDGRWQQVEVYIRRHSDTDFSHGVCPECRTEHYPDV